MSEPADAPGPRRALIVGAGAVGQVYGYHLQRAGWQVGFLVRPKYAERARRGFTLFPLNRPHRGRPVRFEGFEVVEDAARAAAGRWDQLWLAVSTPALQGGWLEELLERLGPIPVISLQPGPEGAARIGGLVPAERRVFGLIAFIAYQAPLPGETRFGEVRGIAYWLPPGPSPFAGPAAVVDPLVRALRAGGCPAAHEAGDLAARAGFASALLQTHIAALEGAGWRWEAVRRGDWLALAARAWREAAAIGESLLGAPAPWWRGLVGPWSARLALRLGPWLIPLDLETYLAYHFTKVGDQTRAHLEHWIRSGRERGLPVEALGTLRERMDAGPPHPGAEAARSG